MAVIVRYIVERNGEEKMAFATKKEADDYDKRLDIAEGLAELIASNDELAVDEELLEPLTFFLAMNKERVAEILKGKRAPAKPKAEADEPEPEPEPAPKERKPRSTSRGKRTTRAA